MIPSLNAVGRFARGVAMIMTAVYAMDALGYAGTKVKTFFTKEPSPYA